MGRGNLTGPFCFGQLMMVGLLSLQERSAEIPVLGHPCRLFSCISDKYILSRIACHDVLSLQRIRFLPKILPSHTVGQDRMSEIGSELSLGRNIPHLVTCRSRIDFNKNIRQLVENCGSILLPIDFHVHQSAACGIAVRGIDDRSFIRGWDYAGNPGNLSRRPGKLERNSPPVQCQLRRHLL